MHNVPGHPLSVPFLFLSYLIFLGSSFFFRPFSPSFFPFPVFPFLSSLPLPFLPSSLPYTDLFLHLHKYKTKVRDRAHSKWQAKTWNYWRRLACFSSIIEGFLNFVLVSTSFLLGHVFRIFKFHPMNILESQHISVRRLGWRQTHCHKCWPCDTCWNWSRREPRQPWHFSVWKIMLNIAQPFLALFFNIF